MPKYRVFIHETEVFRLDVEAPDSGSAGILAMQIQGNASMSSDSFHRELSEVLPLADEAEVEFTAEDAEDYLCDECHEPHSGLAP